MTRAKRDATAAAVATAAVDTILATLDVSTLSNSSTILSQNTIDLNSFRQLWSTGCAQRLFVCMCVCVCLCESQREVSVKHTIYSHAFQKRNYTFQALVFTLTNTHTHVGRHRIAQFRDSSGGRHCLFVSAQCVYVQALLWWHYDDDTNASSTGLDINKSGWTHHRGIGLEMDTICACHRRLTRSRDKQQALE